MYYRWMFGMMYNKASYSRLITAVSKEGKGRREKGGHIL